MSIWWILHLVFTLEHAGPQAVNRQPGSSLMPAYPCWKAGQMAEAGEDQTFPFLKRLKGEELTVGGMCTRVILPTSWHRNYISADLPPIPLPHTPKAEITSASYGNCLVYLLSNCPTQREDACLLKGTELDIAVSLPLSWRPRPELKPSVATSPNSNLCQQDVSLFSKQAEKCVNCRFCPTFMWKFKKQQAPHREAPGT